MKALNHLETILAVTPAVTARLDAWFARPVVTCLRNVGLLTLGDLVRFINVYGYRWHSRVKGFGVQRALQVVAWLRMQYEHLNLAISDTVNEPKSRRALRQSDFGVSLGGAGDLALPGSPASLSQFGQGTLVQIGLNRIQSSPVLAGASH